MAWCRVVLVLAMACVASARPSVETLEKWLHHAPWLNLFQGHVGGYNHHHHPTWTYHLTSTCNSVVAQECCQFPRFSPLFHACCAAAGCCPLCESTCKGCRLGWWCRKQRGICRKYRCEADEKYRWGCFGHHCRCCIRDEAEVTTDCDGASECCQYEAETGDFFNCCKKYNCCPICQMPGCEFGNQTFSAGEVIKSYPERCLQLQCNITTTDSAPFFQADLVEVSPANSTCGCCELGGQLYEDGYLLTQDDYCISVQCVNGKWTNQNFFNADCRACQVQAPLAAIVSYDNTVSQVSDSVCTYSATQEGSSETPDSYVYVDFMDSSTGGGFVDHESYTFKDPGADPLTCPAGDVDGCSFGPVDECPTEVTDVGTLAFSMNLGSIEFQVIMGVNKIATLYAGNSLLIFAPLSKQGELAGLCGPYNGNGSDDLTTRPGTVTTDVQEFTDSWKVPVDCVSRKRSLEARGPTQHNCDGLSQEEQANLDATCTELLQGTTDYDVLHGECVQMMCMCVLTGSEECTNLAQETAALWKTIKDLEKTPKELAIMLQGYSE